MLDYIYPEEEQRFFTNRERHLALLASSRTLLAEGIRKHLALSGFRRDPGSSRGPASRPRRRRSPGVGDHDFRPGGG